MIDCQHRLIVLVMRLAIKPFLGMHDNREYLRKLQLDIECARCPVLAEAQGRKKKDQGVSDRRE